MLGKTTRSGRTLRGQRKTLKEESESEEDSANLEQQLEDSKEAHGFSNNRKRQR